MVPPRVSRPIGAPAKISRHCCRMDSPSLGVTKLQTLATKRLKGLSRRLTLQRPLRGDFDASEKTPRRWTPRPSHASTRRAAAGREPEPRAPTCARHARLLKPA